MNEQKQFINKAELAKRYGVSVPTVKSWMRAKKIPYIKVGSVVRFDISEVDASIRLNCRFAAKHETVDTKLTPAPFSVG